jgi:hypothetical protein
VTRPHGGWFCHLHDFPTANKGELGRELRRQSMYLNTAEYLVYGCFSLHALPPHCPYTTRFPFCVGFVCPAGVMEPGRPYHTLSPVHSIFLHLTSSCWPSCTHPILRWESVYACDGDLRAKLRQILLRGEGFHTFTR